ncbi:hypothetical protein KIPB_002995 [Kipferlia bialata]|uniref:Uncharacterized protein n=1 Tax=Kipferlia bialata TaxID=797122 RepID=A0A9K3CS96_9EUKA|nr:hypothetical protein KIPB_002995 [Kipferlia bialata]|eukprot:g2995.t1
MVGFSPLLTARPDLASCEDGVVVTTTGTILLPCLLGASHRGNTWLSGMLKRGSAVPLGETCLKTAMERGDLEGVRSLSPITGD